MKQILELLPIQYNITNKSFSHVHVKSRTEHPFQLYNLLTNASFQDSFKSHLCYTMAEIQRCHRRLQDVIHQYTPNISRTETFELQQYDFGLLFVYHVVKI